MDSLVQTDTVFPFLRFGDEPTRHFDERRIHRLLMQNLKVFMERLERFYFAWKTNDDLVVQPKKLIFENNGLKGDWRVMPCVIDRFENRCIKAVKVIGTNEEQRQVPDKICVGKAFLIDEFDNFIKASFDVSALSSFRTAAISAVAFKHSGRFRRNGVGIIGAGRIGYYTCRILFEWLGVKEVFIHDLIAARANGLAVLFKNQLNVKVFSEMNDLLELSRAVFLVTDAEHALLDSGNARHLEFISSVGADAQNLSELDISLLDEHLLISESRQNIAFGDMSRWQEQGALVASDITELRDLVGDDVESKRDVLFVSTGTAVQDALACDFIHSLASKG